MKAMIAKNTTTSLLYHVILLLLLLLLLIIVGLPYGSSSQQQAKVEFSHHGATATTYDNNNNNNNKNDVSYVSVEADTTTITRTLNNNIGPSSSSSSAFTFTFVVVPKSVDNPFFDLARTGCEDAAQLLGGTCLWIGPEIEDPDGSVQREIIAKMIFNHILSKQQQQQQQQQPEQQRPPTQSMGQNQNNDNDNNNNSQTRTNTTNSTTTTNTTTNSSGSSSSSSSMAQSRMIDGLAISVTNLNSISPLIDQAIQAGIQVVTFDSDAPQSRRAAYIGTNNTFFGVQLGKIVKQLVPNGGTYAIVSGKSPNIKAREYGLRQELHSILTIEGRRGRGRGRGSGKKNTWIELGTSPSNMESDPKLAIHQMDQFAQLNPTVIIPVLGAPMRSGLWKEFFNDHRHRNITIVNGDAMRNQLQLMDSGYVHGLVGQLPYEMGFRSIHVLWDLVSSSSSHSSRTGTTTTNILPPQTPLEIIGTNVLTHIYVPLILPELIVNHNLVGDLIYVGYILFFLVAIVSIGLAYWTYKCRHIHVVQVSQPLFLHMIAVGVIILSSSLVPLSFDDDGNPLSISDTRGTWICMSVPWLGNIGFTITFVALFIKLHRVNRLFQSDSFGRIKITERHVMGPMFILVVTNIVILLCWTFFDPLIYIRQEYQGTDGWGRTIATYGACRSSHPIRYLSPLAVINAGVLIMANWSAYKARALESEFAESKYIAIAMGSMLQALLSGVPVMFVVRDLPKAFYLVLVFIIFITSMAILLVMFVPKLIYAEDFARFSSQEQERRMRSSVQDSVHSLQRQGSVASSTRGGRRGSEMPTATIREAGRLVGSSTPPRRLLRGASPGSLLRTPPAVPLELENARAGTNGSAIHIIEEEESKIGDGSDDNMKIADEGVKETRENCWHPDVMPSVSNLEAGKTATRVKQLPPSRSNNCSSSSSSCGSGSASSLRKNNTSMSPSSSVAVDSEGGEEDVVCA